VCLDSTHWSRFRVCSQQATQEQLSALLWAPSDSTWRPPLFLARSLGVLSSIRFWVLIIGECELYVGCKSHHFWVIGSIQNLIKWIRMTCYVISLREKNELKWQTQKHQWVSTCISNCTCSLNNRLIGQKPLKISWFLEIAYWRNIRVMVNKLHTCTLAQKNIIGDGVLYISILGNIHVYDVSACRLIYIYRIWTSSSTLIRVGTRKSCCWLKILWGKLHIP